MTRRVLCRVVIVTVSVCLVAGVSGCAHRVAGRPAAQDSKAKEVAVRAPDDYQYPADGSGYGRGAIDQPAPVPGYNWQGWSAQPAGRCAWVPPGLFDGLAPRGYAATGHFCSFYTADGNTIQIAWGLAYNPFNYDMVAFSRPATIAGLEAKVHDLKKNQDVYPGSCHVRVDTRSTSGLGVLLWNEQNKPLDREASCGVATQVAERIVRSLVPAAGGRVWAPTPQRPNPATVGTKACEVMNDSVTVQGVIEVGDDKHVEGQGERGATCTAETKYRKAEGLLTTGPGQGLAGVPPSSGAEVTVQKVGLLPAARSPAGIACRFGW